MKRFQFINNLTGWVVFAISLVVYLLTIEPTASFWDCGEFISTADKMEIGHPPGAPFFMLMARFFILFASEASEVAKMVNIFSATMSALTILFLFWTITHMVRVTICEDRFEVSSNKTIVIMGCGIIGALAYTFSDTFWFSAVEAEVYASSSMFTAVVFWAILKWEDIADKPYANRWLVLIAYLMGLSIGVHLLNLLSIPALVLVYYFRKNKNTTTKGIIYSLIFSCFLLAVILYGVVPGFVTTAGWFELFFVNTLGCSFNTGTVIYSVVLIACLIYGIYITFNKGEELTTKQIAFFVASVVLLGIPFFGTHIFLGIVLTIGLAAFLFYSQNSNVIKKPVVLLNTIMICLTVILLGYSTYAVLIIRSCANPTMDQNSPDDVFALKSYLNRDQYGDTPLLYGESYASEYKRTRSGTVAYDEGYNLYAKAIKKNENEADKYIVYDTKKTYQYQSQFQMLFPRMHSKQQSHVKAYKSWGGVNDKNIIRADNGKKIAAPTQADNMQFFFTYQVGFMYWRYFMWNFVGRQNDIQGHGEITNGNWISGIPFIDNLLVGDQESLPDIMKENRGRNTYYFLPLILGIFGILSQFSRGKKGMQSFWLTLVLFVMTGLAIVVYLNQTPYQPRERDYAYAGSFYAFCIWIGFGVLYIAQLLNQFISNKKICAVIALAMSSSVPTVLAVQNWDDHDRSGRFICRDYGANYLRSIPSQGIIFTNGDNDTFPLWYNQEVEGEGTDKRVGNLSYLQMDWYVDQMQNDAYDSKALPMGLKSADYSNGKLDVVYIDDKFESLTIDQAFEFMLNTNLSKNLGYRDNINILPTKKIIVPVDYDAVIAAGFKPTVDDIDTTGGVKKIKPMVLDFSGKNYLGKQDLFILDLIRSNKDWKTPIYFAVTVGSESYSEFESVEQRVENGRKFVDQNGKPVMGDYSYLRLEGMGYRVTPFKRIDAIDTDIMYDNMMNKFAWGNVKDPNTYMDENAMRMGKTFRHMFLRLADGLIAEGKKDSAIAVLDKCMEELPTYNVYADYSNVRISNMYLGLGEIEKGKALRDEITTTCKQYRDWFNKLSENQKKSASNDVAQYWSMYDSLNESAKRAEDTEYSDANTQTVNDFYRELAKYFSKR